MNAADWAIAIDPDVPEGFRRIAAQVPEPAHDELLIAVSAFSLNFGELPRHMNFPPGTAMGFEAAGTVVRAAADGSGPPVGARVVSWRWGGAWAKQRAVRADEVAVIPDDLDEARAVALVGAGLTALQGLRMIGAILGRAVLVTGAAGGVGRIALQLARLGGAARVAAVVGSAERGAGLAELGATDIVTSVPDAPGEYFGVLESIGGRSFRDALHKTQAGGTLVSIGFRAWEPIVLEPRTDVWPGLLATRRIVGMTIGAGPQVAPGETMTSDLGWLMDLARDGRLDPCVAWTGGLDALSEGFRRLDERRLAGKAVIRVDA